MKMTYRVTIFLIALALATIFISIRTSDAYDFSANIVAVWLMDEGEGKEIKDSSGNGHTGEFFGNPEWTEGKFGKGIQFHGAPDHIDVPGSDHELTPEHITVVCWVKLDDIVGTQAIMEQYDWAPEKGAYCLRTSDTQLRFYIQKGASDVLASGGSVKADEWFHAAATYDGEKMKAWVNGVVGTFDRPGVLWPSDKSLSFGVRGDTKDVHWMQGVLDETAIFDEALPEEDIQDIMTNGFKNILAVSQTGKLAQTWATIKSQ